MYRVVIRGDDGYEHVVATGKTLGAAERIADGASINLNHDDYSVGVEEETDAEEEE